MTSREHSNLAALDGCTCRGMSRYSDGSIPCSGNIPCSGKCAAICAPTSLTTAILDDIVYLQSLWDSALKCLSRRMQMHTPEANLQTNPPRYATNLTNATPASTNHANPQAKSNNRQIK
jgi:hypothetical protein